MYLIFGMITFLCILGLFSTQASAGSTEMKIKTTAYGPGCGGKIEGPDMDAHGKPIGNNRWDTGSDTVIAATTRGGRSSDKSGTSDLHGCSGTITCGSKTKKIIFSDKYGASQSGFKVDIARDCSNKNNSLGECTIKVDQTTCGKSQPIGKRGDINPNKKKRKRK